ncbi:MAG: pyrimidine/purine nucleoside phosphorylase [Campylobacterota bacterium]|nr:pyrimidine/purine nucleoside phosphorylase [Campylobacterota bacterium]
MMQLENVSVEVAGNSYFDGAVTSRTVLFADGSKKTLGFMQVGEYEFGAEAPELMEITSGEVEILRPNESEWQSIKGGESFNVEGNASFKIKVKSVTDYCCSYL